jgi:hypothetical protein
MFGIAAAALAIGILFTSCPTDEGSSYSGPPSVKYAGMDNSGTTYVLDITGGTSNSPEPGDTYVLTITDSSGSKKTSRGTVGPVTGDNLTLQPSSPGAASFTVTVAATGIYGFSGNIAVEEDDTPVSPPGETTPTKPGNPNELDPTAPPRITNIQVLRCASASNNITQYNGSGDVYIRMGARDFGRINNGKLSLVFPYPVPVTVWTLESFTERSEDTVELTHNITLSNSTTSGFLVGDLGFLEDSGSDRTTFGFVKDINKTDANNGTCVFISYLYVDKPLTITGTLNWKEVVTGGTWTTTYETQEQWNLNLQPGWNKIQREFSRTGSGSGTTTITEIYTNALDDTSFQWTIDTLSP